MSNSTVTREFNNIIPNEIDSEVKLGKGFGVFMLGFMVAWFVFSQAFSNIVHPSLQLLYFIANTLLSLFLALPSRKNDGMKVFQTLMLSFSKDDTVYHPMEEWEVPEDED